MYVIDRIIPVKSQGQSKQKLMQKEMNEVLVLIEEGHTELIQEEWIIKATKEPLRLFPCSPVFS